MNKVEESITEELVERLISIREDKVSVEDININDHAARQMFSLWDLLNDRAKELLIAAPMNNQISNVNHRPKPAP